MASPLTELSDVIQQFNGRVGDARVPTSRTPGTATPLRSAKKNKYTSPYLSTPSLRRTPRKYTTDSTSKSMRDMSLLGATQESDAVVQLLKKRLREKTKSETSLMQDISSSKSQINTLKALLSNEKNAKEEAQRDIMELEDTLSSLRARYEDKSRKEVQLLKDTNRLEIEIKELASTIEDMSDAESLMKQQLRDARTRLRSTEQELFDSNFTVTATSNQLEVEESAARELRDELRDREGKRVRNEHTHKLVTEALEKRVERSEQEATELAGQLRDAEEQVRKLTSAMFETDEEAQKMKQTFERLFKEQGESIEDLQTALASKTASVADLSSRLEESESHLKLARDELDAKQRAAIENSNQIRLLREQIRGLEDRLSTKQSDFASITQAYELLKADKKLTEVRIHNLEENLADTTTHLGHEKDKAQHLKDLYEESKADYDQTKRMMEASALQIIDLERQITESSQSENRARIEANGLRTKIMNVTEKLDRTEMTLSKTNEKLDITNREMDDLDEKCKTLQSDLDTTRHQGKLREQELVQNIEERDAAIGRLRAAIDTADNNAAMARESLQRTTEEALKEKSRVERLLSDSNSSNAMMKAQLEVLQARAVDLESDLVKSRDRCSQFEAQLTASRNTSLEMGRVNEQEKMSLESKMKAAMQDLEHTKRELERTRVACHTLETRNEAGEADRNSLHQRLVTLQRECNKQSNLLSEKERLETEQSNKIAAQSTSLRILEQRLEDRTEKLGQAQSKVLEYENLVEIGKTELRDSNGLIKKLQEDLARERTLASELETELKTREGQHVADAHGVRLKLAELQQALIDRGESVDRLAGALQTTEANARELQARLEEASQDAEDSRSSFEQRLEEVGAERAQIVLELEKLRTSHKALLDRAARKEERLKQSMLESQEKSDRIQILENAENASRASQGLLKERIEKKSSIAHQLQDQLSSKEESLSLLRNQLSEKQRVELTMMKQLKIAEKELRDMKSRLQEKVENEDQLMSQLEEQKLKWSHYSGDVKELQVLKSQLNSSEKSRQELTGVLMKLLKRDGLELSDVLNSNGPSLMLMDQN